MYWAHAPEAFCWTIEMRRIAVILPIALLLTVLLCHAQQEYAVWHFGSNAGIDFRTSPPTPITCPFKTVEGSTVLCNGVTGALLLSTEGSILYNRDGVPMPNGRGLAGHSNSTQPAIALPQPGHRTLVYLFTSDAGGYIDPPGTGINYSTVDLALDNGLGDVVAKNVPLLPTAAEMLCAVRRPDSCSYWIIAHGWEDNAFHAWLFDSRGVVDPPVISRVGSIHRDPANLPNSGIGTISIMKASMDGRHIAVTGLADSIVEVFSFDPASGVLSAPLSLPSSGLDYGVSFSPDARQLYVASNGDPVNSILPTLVQYDLSAGSAAAVVASRTMIYSAPDSFSYKIGALQLAPDGRIYLAKVDGPWLGVINNPNGAGAACNYQPYGFRMAYPAASARYGLPTIVESMSLLQGSACNTLTAAFTPNDTTICAGTCVRFADRSSNDPVAWRWSAVSATPGTSTEQNPTFCFEQSGRYPITLIASNGPSSDTVVQWIEVTSSAEISNVLGLRDSTSPGDTVPISVTVQQRPNGIGRRYRATLDLGATGRLRLDSVALDPAIAGAMNVDSVLFDRAANRWTAVLVWNGPSSAPPDGPWLYASGIAALTSDDTAHIVCRITSIDAAGCVGARPDTAHIRVAVCGLQYRLIESTGAKYSLDIPQLDRATATLTVQGSLGLDGPLTVELFDQTGAAAGSEQLAALPAGRFSRTLSVARLAIGTYLLRVRSGEWTRSTTVQIVR